MQSTVSTHLAWLCVITISLAVYPAWLQKPPKRKVVGGNAKAVGCCEEVRELKMQVANLTALIEELSKKQEDEMGNAIVQMMEMEGSLKQMDLRLNDVEGKYSEMNNQLGIVQLQAAQTVTQTSAGKEVKLPPLHIRTPTAAKALLINADGKNAAVGFVSLGASSGTGISSGG